MEFPKEFVLTSAVVGLRDFLMRSGARHALLIGAGGTGKTMALQYLAYSLRAENHLVVMVRVGGIDTGDQLVVTIARALLDQSKAQARPLEFDPLDQIRAQFEEQYTASQRLSRAAEMLERIIQLVMERTSLKGRAYIFLDGLDEAYQAGDIVVAVENLAERLTSTSLVVASRESSAVNRLSMRGAFDTFKLTPLTQAESAELIRRLIPERSIAEPAFEQLIARAEGSPLVLGLLTSHFREYGDLRILEETDPIRLFDRFFLRILGSDQAGTDARLLLSLLIFFQPVSTAYLTEISALPAERARAALAKLSGSVLVSASETQVAFAHTLVAKYHLENNLITRDIDTSAFQFGDEAAERDVLLKQTFMPPRDLHFVASGTKTIVLGDRGAGKSAIFRALQESNRTALTSTDATQPLTITSASQNPASFVQQMTADDSITSSADGFKAIWLLYSAALAARDVHASADSEDQNTKAFVKDARTILRRIGWANSIKGESAPSRWLAAVRSILPEKVTLKLGPVTVEPNMNRRGKGWLGTDIKIDDFIDCTDRLLQATDRRLLIVFDQIDEAFKYQRDRQEALVQGLFLAESFLSLRQAIRLIVLLRTDLFELYDIQEKNKFVSRTVRLDWSREELRKQLLQRLFSNDDLRAVMASLNGSALQPSVLAQIQFRIAFPIEVEGKPFEEWLFDNLKNGKNHIAPRQIILFLNITRDKAKDDQKRRRIPLFSEKEVADAMTRVSELSYEEVISDFRAATVFVRNCRAGKIVEFELEKVEALFDEREGSVVLQLERLERLGFLVRTIVKEGDSLVPRFRIPRLFTRFWET
jgi:AAA ATPase-like protein